LYYELLPIACKDLDSELPEIEISDKFNVVGELYKHILVSVPATTSKNAAIELQTQLETQLKKPVIILTHNISVLSARLLDSQETKFLRKQLARAIHDQDRTTAVKADSVKQETVGDRDAPSSVRCRSGVCQNGNGDSTTGSAGPADSCGGCEGCQDCESSEKE
jgi:hypothetical protein